MSDPAPLAALMTEVEQLRVTVKSLAATVKALGVPAPLVSYNGRVYPVTPAGMRDLLEETVALQAALLGARARTLSAMTRARHDTWQEAATYVGQYAETHGGNVAAEYLAEDFRQFARACESVPFSKRENMPAP